MATIDLTDGLIIANIRTQLSAISRTGERMGNDPLTEEMMTKETVRFLDFIKSKENLYFLLFNLANGGIDFSLDFELDPFSDEQQIDLTTFKLGIKTYEATWSWWRFRTFEDGTLVDTFEGKYSQNTGKTKKSFNEGYKTNKELKRKLGIIGSEYSLLEGFDA